MGVDPEHQVKLWSDIDLGRHVEWGLGWRYEPRAIHRRPATRNSTRGWREADALRAGHQGRSARGTSSRARALRDHRSECRGGPNGTLLTCGSEKIMADDRRPVLDSHARIMSTLAQCAPQNQSSPPGVMAPWRSSAHYRAS